MTTMTMKDEKRIEAIQLVFRGELTVGEAAMILAVSERQCYRIKARWPVRIANGPGFCPLDWRYSFSQSWMDSNLYRFVPAK